MALIDVQNLVTLLSNGQADATTFPGLYADVINDLGGDDWLTAAVPITFTEGSTSVDLPPNLLNIISIIYDDTVLSDLTLRELESLSNGSWRNQVGRTIAFTRESEQVKSIEVWKTPTQTSPLIIPVHGLPVGEDYQPGNGISIHSESRTDAMPYLTVPIALKVLAREYYRESPHMDFAFAGLCDMLGTMILGFLK
jgi:hypothetical protein